MRSINEALALTDPTEVLKEIRIRRDLRNQMVGSLYPSILADEAGRLLEQYEALAREGIAAVEGGSDAGVH
jgi:hypothetical protein